MFFGNNDFSVKLISVHLLSWGHRDVLIPPKKTFALSYRDVGDCSFICDGYERSASSGDICYFPKGVGYRIKAGRERLYGINFEVEGQMPNDIMVFGVKKNAFFETAFSELYRVWTERDSGYYARALSYFYRIISEMVRERDEGRAGAAYMRLKPALSMMYSGYMNPALSVSLLAEHIGVSDTYFRRIFERVMGERPLDFLNKLRISYAKEHLDSGLYMIESVAEMCGFSDSKYFATVFKRIVGISPSEYKRRHG